MKKVLIFIVFLYATGLNAASVVSFLIASNTLVEQNEKIINDIFFSTIAKHNFAFTEAQKEEVANIAYQCPYTGGEAVYRARVLHTALTGLTDFNDSTACTNQGINWRKGNTLTPENILSVSLVPNPTNGKASFVFSEKTESNCSITIFNLLGQKVNTYSLFENTESFDFDTQTFSKGMYYYKVSGLSTSLSGKFIVEK